MDKHALAVTVDIEDWYHIPSVTGSPFSTYRDTDEFFTKWNGRYDYLTEPTARVLDLLDVYDISATFFVVGEIVDRYPGLVEEIADRGHEVACHGLSHACKIDPTTKLPLMTPAEFKERTTKARSLLEHASGQKVTGYRAPSAMIGAWMRDALEDMGFAYDSSVSRNSLYNKTDRDLSSVSTMPYTPLRNGFSSSGNGVGFIEFPWSMIDIMGMKIPTSGGPMLRFLGSHVVLRGLRQSLARGHAVLYFHPLDISDEKFPVAGNGRPFYWAIKGRIIEKRLRYIFQDLWDVPIKNLGTLAGDLNGS